MKKILLFLLFLSLFACQNEQKTENKRLRIVCTTSMIADALQNITADSAQVIALMGAGVDPHLYKATQGDLEKLSSADIIFYNGLHLEGKMGDILEKLARQKTVIPISEVLDKNSLKLTDPNSHTYDPHIWFDVALWAEAVDYASKKLQEKFPKNKDFYQKNTQNYLEKLDQLHQKVQTEILQIPLHQRVLITSHDAFGYFGRAYQMEVKGLQGISTVADFGLNDITELVKFISERQIKAVFVETSVSKKSIEAVLEGCQQRGHNTKIGGTLFSDAMGEKGTPEGTYIGMVEANLRVIVEALR